MKFLLSLRVMHVETLPIVLRRDYWQRPTPSEPGCVSRRERACVTKRHHGGEVSTKRGERGKGREREGDDRRAKSAKSHGVSR